MRLRLVADNGDVPDRPRRCPECSTTEAFWRERELQHRATIANLKATALRWKAKAKAAEEGKPRPSAPRPPPRDVTLELNDLRQQRDIYARRYARMIQETTALRAEVEQLRRELDRATFLHGKAEEWAEEGPPMPLPDEGLPPEPLSTSKPSP